MRTHKAAAARVILRSAANLLLGGTHVNDNLVVTNLVQDLRYQLHGCAHGDGHHNDIGLLHAGVEVCHFIHQADGEGRLGRNGILLHAQGTGRKAPAPEIQRQGAADEAQAYDSDYLHTTLIFSSAFVSVGTLAQREMRRYLAPLLPKMKPGVRNTPAS